MGAYYEDGGKILREDLDNLASKMPMLPQSRRQPSETAVPVLPKGGVECPPPRKLRNVC